MWSSIMKSQEGSRPRCRCVNQDSNLSPTDTSASLRPWVLGSDLSLQLLRRSGTWVHLSVLSNSSSGTTGSVSSNWSMRWVELSFCSGPWAKTHWSFQSLSTVCSFFFFSFAISLHFSLTFCLFYQYLFKIFCLNVVQKTAASVYTATLIHYCWWKFGLLEIYEWTKL